jgi:hypothetical protein
VAVVLFPAPFDPFIWDVPHYSLVWFWARFWDEVYGTYWQWPHLVLLVVVPCFLLLRARLERTVLRAGLRSSLIFLLVAGIVYQIIPFSGDVYPAIAASVGGGHPRLVEISFQPSFQQSTFGKMPNGYYLLWHETSDSVVLTGANDGPLARTYLIRSDHVLAMVVHDAHVRLRDGAIESVVLHGNGTCDMQQHFAAPPL